jgi:hypothetical protein
VCVPAGARRAQRVRLVEVPRQLRRAEPDGRPVAHEMIAQLVTFLDQAAQWRFAAGDSLTDQEERRPRSVASELGYRTRMD